MFATAREKADYLDGAASLDARHPLVRETAVRLVRDLAPDAWEAMVTRIHRYVRDGIRYVHDPQKLEELADAPTVIARGFDDCDGKSRTFVALCRAVGIEARVRPVFTKWGAFVHVQAEARWKGSTRFPQAQPGGWVLAELTIRDCALGQDPQTARDLAGHLRLR